MNDVCIPERITADYSENVNYNFKEYPIYVRDGILSQYPNYSAVSHWHEDLEFIVIRSGHMAYHVNGTVLHLSEGNGIMVNSRQFHYGYSEDFTECAFICILIHPSLLRVNDFFENTYVTPITSDEEHPYLLLEQQIPWQKQILDTLRAIRRQIQEEHAILRIQQSVFNLWLPLYQHFPKQQKTSARDNRQLAAVKKMVAFVQENYREKLSLEQIADAGNVCKSSCSALFRKYLQKTPIAYLTEYRLGRSVDLLFSTDLSITEISYEVGFHNASYYSETFRKYFHCTPREYARKNKRQL